MLHTGFNPQMQFLVVLHRLKKKFERLLRIFFRESYSKSLLHVEKHFKIFWVFFLGTIFLLPRAKLAALAV